MSSKMQLLGPLLVFVLVCRAFTCAAQPLPASWVLLPIAAIDNTTLTAAFDCHPTYTSAPCAGHGECNLLLDAAAPASIVYLKAASQPALPVTASGLDSTGLDSSTPLPAAVCLCHDGYTGRADYVRHGAQDGDSCGVYQPAINRLAVAGCILYSALIVLVLVRLRGWYVWHRSTVLAAEAGYLPPTPPQPHAPMLHHKTASTTLINVSPPLRCSKLQTAARVHPLSPAAPCETIAVEFERSAESHRQLWKHLRHQSFTHPFCSLVLSILALVYFSLRLCTWMVVGDSALVSAVIYLHHVPYILASSIGLWGTMQLASSVARMKLVNGVDVVTIAKRCMIALCLYQTVSWAVALSLLHNTIVQHTAVQLFLLLCLCPDFLLGPFTLWAVIRIVSALRSNLDTLSPEQRFQRRVAQDKLTQLSCGVTVFTAGGAVVCLALAASARLCNAVMPYYALVWHFGAAAILALRLVTFKPPSTVHAVCIMPRACAVTCSKAEASGGGGSGGGGGGATHSRNSASNTPHTATRHVAAGSLPRKKSLMMRTQSSASTGGSCQMQCSSRQPKVGDGAACGVGSELVDDGGVCPYVPQAQPVASPTSSEDCSVTDSP